MKANTFYPLIVATYDPRSIANFFIEAAQKEGKTLTPPQLVKLVYLAHGWFLGWTGEPLLNEAPEALEFGPVVPTLYNALRIYGNDPIPEKISVSDAQSSSAATLAKQEYAVPAESNILSFLDNMWKVYGNFSPADLTALTNQPGTPWEQTWREQGASYTNGVDIPPNLLQDYYKQLNANVISSGTQANANVGAVAAASRD